MTSVYATLSSAKIGHLKERTMPLPIFHRAVDKLLNPPEKVADCKHEWPAASVCFFHDTIHRCKKCGYGLKIHISFGQITIEEVHD